MNDITSLANTIAIQNETLHRNIKSTVGCIQYFNNREMQFLAKNIEESCLNLQNKKAEIHQTIASEANQKIFDSMEQSFNELQTAFQEAKNVKFIRKNRISLTLTCIDKSLTQQKALLEQINAIKQQIISNSQLTTTEHIEDGEQPVFIDRAISENTGAGIKIHDNQKTPPSQPLFCTPEDLAIPVVKSISDYNETQSSENKTKLSNVIIAFFNTRILDESTTKEFCQLAYCTDKDIVQECLRKLINTINIDLSPHPLHIEALEFFLRKSSLSCLNPHLIVEISSCLIKKLDPKIIHVSESTEPYIHLLLDALELTFLRMIELRVTQLMKNGLYLQFDTILNALSLNEFYPIAFHAKIMQQSLREIRDDETQWQKVKNISWETFNGLIKIAGGVGGTDPTKILEGSISVAKAIQMMFAIREGSEEIWRTLHSLKKIQTQSWAVALRDVQWPLLQAATSENPQELDQAFQVVQDIYSKQPSHELLFGIVLLVKKISQFGVLNTRLKSVEWLMDLFKNKEIWGISNLTPFTARQIPKAPREEILRCLLQLASDRTILPLSDKAKSSLCHLKAHFLSKETSSGREIIESMMADVDTAILSTKPMRLPIDLFPIGSALSRNATEGLVEIKSDINDIRQQIAQIAGAPLSEALDILRQSIKEDEYRQVETNTLYIPTQCAHSRDQIAKIDKRKPTWDVIQEFMSSDKKVLVIYAPGGAGKTVITQRLEQYYLDLYNQNRGGIIPHRIELTGLKNPVHYALEEGLQNKGFTNTHIQELKKRPGLIILDAVDEARFEGKRLTSQNPLYFTNRLYQWTQSKVIFGIRLDDAAGGPTIESKQFYSYANDNREHPQPKLLQEIFLCPYQQESQSEYLTQYLKNAPQEWFEGNQRWTVDQYLQMISLIKDAKGLAETPFTLRILAEVLPSLVREATQSNGGYFTPNALELTQTMLYEEFLTKWFNREETKLIGRTDIPEEMTREGIQSLLWCYCMELAAKMRSTGSEGITKVIYRDSRGKIDKEWESFFGEDIQTRIKLRMAPLKRVREEYSFLHKHIRDFLVARYSYIEDLNREQT